jgi:DEAD/DEAH box helicase domain-containing protein
VLAPQLCCAAAELPLTERDLPMFGPSSAEVLDALVSAGRLRQRPTGWYWTDRARPDADIRGTGSTPISIIDPDGTLLGTVEAGAAHGAVHPGAVYLHQGQTFVVDALDLDDQVATVHAEEPDWTTSPRDLTDIGIVSSAAARAYGPVGVYFGTVEVTNQVIAYVRRRIATGEVLDETPLELPARELRTRAVWYTISPAALESAGLGQGDIPGAAHAAEHAAIGLLPLFATCDRWDIGGVSTALHPDTGLPTVFVYDGHPGGAGFAERGHELLPAWLAATRAAIASCECESGCPSCVQSPKCGNGNDPLDKAGAVRLLDLVLDHLGPAGEGRGPATG